jgi:hypothetical protein
MPQNVTDLMNRPFAAGVSVGQALIALIVVIVVISIWNRFVRSRLHR